jgi:DNA-binding NarL/FixJ family response regulator
MDGAIRVLIADDSPLLREAIRRFVSELAGVEVVGLSRDGAEALVQASEVHPDVVIIDSSMPVLDGFEATRLLKCRQVAPAVVVCSLEDADDERRAASAAGADALVRKRDLARRLEGLIAELAPRRRLPTAAARL